MVVEYHPQCLVGDYWQAVRFWPELLGPREGLDLAWTARDAEFLATTLLAHVFPSIKDRFQIRSNVRAALRGEKSDDLAWNTLTISRNKNKNRGALVAIRNTKYQGEISSPMAAGFLPESWACDLVNEVYIRRLLDLARSREITVYWLIPPVSPELQARREQKGLDALYTRFARGFLRSLRELGRARRPALGLRRVGLPRPGAPRSPGGVHAERRRGRPAPCASRDRDWAALDRAARLS